MVQCIVSECQQNFESTTEDTQSQQKHNCMDVNEALENLDAGADCKKNLDHTTTEYYIWHKAG
jgi:hypothetical protein